jgi:hypothetical protein
MALTRCSLFALTIKLNHRLAQRIKHPKILPPAKAYRLQDPDGAVFGRRIDRPPAWLRDISDRKKRAVPATFHFAMSGFRHSLAFAK